MSTTHDVKTLPLGGNCAGRSPPDAVLGNAPSWLSLHACRRLCASFGMVCGTAVFLSAFLVFQIQPIISKMIMPWFGGGRAIWTTSLLFFQLVLLAGYAYAHLLTRLFVPKWRAVIHLGLLACSLTLLPVTPGDVWKPVDGENPIGRILALLLVHVGLPYLLLSASAPLLQAWYAGVYPQRTAYRLYSLSNLGSLAALLSYPLLVEPLITGTVQGLTWSAGLVAFSLLTACLTAQMWIGVFSKDRQAEVGRQTNKRCRTQPVTARSHTKTAWWSWVGLSMVGSMTLMSTTNQICQEIAAVPLLWILPLCLYLLTFIISFDRIGWSGRRCWAGLTLAAILAAACHRIGWFWEFDREILVEILLYSCLLFSLCMLCHGELVRRKPAAERLTSFYFAISLGGAAGGLFVGLICPLVFSTLLEAELTLICGWLLATGLLIANIPARSLVAKSALYATASVGTLAGLYLVYQGTLLSDGTLLNQTRNFYGVLSVRLEEPRPGNTGRALYHGSTLHGFQFISDNRRNEPTTYFDRNSGVGIALNAMNQRGPLRVGAVGLGTGTIATYGRKGDHYCFYEINPDIVKLAQSSFTFLSDTAADVQVALGDARIVLERQSPQNYDVLILDAFSGDAIPIHLLTIEAFDLYARHLKPDAVIAVHVSNRYLNLHPVVMNAAKHLGWQIAAVETMYPEDSVNASSEWLLLTKCEDFIRQPKVRRKAKFSDGTGRLVVWTDQFSNLLSVID